MGVKIKFMSALKEVTGSAEVVLDASFDTYGKIMEELIRLFPRLKEEIFYPDGTIDYVYQISLNGQRLSWPEDKDVRVKNADQIVFMVFMSGG